MSKPFDLYTAFCDDLHKYQNADIPSVLVAFSGGADSTVLLDLYRRYAAEHGTILHALHLNHMIRPDAEHDEAFCRSYCDRHGIPFACFRKDIPAYAKTRKKGLEEAARDVRYRLLENYRAEQGIAVIATAHTASDNTETMLFRMTRGTAVKGLGGIPRKRDTIIRPLLSFTKTELLTYAEQEGLSYCTDSTNDDLAYSRNLLRKKAIPVLTALNPLCDKAFLRLSEEAREDDAALYALALPYADCRDTKTLATLPDALLKRVLLINYQKKAHTEIDRFHLLQALNKIRAAAVGSFSGAVSFPDSLSLFITPKEIWFDREKLALPSAIPPTALSVGLPVPFGRRFLITVGESDRKNAFCSFSVPQNALSAITVRTRQNGDRYRAGGMTRQIKKLLCDSKMPKALRDDIPIFLYHGEILYIPTLPPSDLLRNLLSQADIRYQITVHQVYSDYEG